MRLERYLKTRIDKAVMNTETPMHEQRRVVASVHARKLTFNNQVYSFKKLPPQVLVEVISYSIIRLHTYIIDMRKQKLNLKYIHPGLLKDKISFALISFLYVMSTLLFVTLHDQLVSYYLGN